MTYSKSTIPSWFFFLSSTLALLLLTTCANDSDQAPTADFDSAYGLGMNIDTPSRTFGLITAVPNLEPQADIDPAFGREVGAAMYSFMPAGARNTMYVGNNEDFVMTRYQLDEGGLWQEDGRFSLAGQGISFLGPYVVFISDTKAYYFDDDQRQLIVWNPETMTITKTVPLPMIEMEDFQPNFSWSGSIGSNEAPIVDGRVYKSLQWFDASGEPVLLTGLLVIDAETDSVEAFTTTDRCPNALHTVSTSDGIYFATWEDLFFNDAVRNSDIRPSCILKLAPDQNDFDSGFKLTLTDVFDGRVAAGMYNVGLDTQVLVRVLDENIAPYASSQQDLLYTAEAWEWWLLDLETREVTEIEGFAKSPPTTATYLADGRAYVALPSSDFASTTLVEFSADFQHRQVLGAPGFMVGMSRVR